jgi:hypothetical protein
MIASEVPVQSVDRNGVARVHPQSQQSPTPDSRIRTSSPAPPKQGGISNDPLILQIQQKYAQETPYKLSLHPAAPPVLAQYLNPTEPQLNAMTPDQRQQLALVFLSVAMIYTGRNDFRGVYLVGTKLRGYLPAGIVRHFEKIRGV